MPACPNPRSCASPPPTGPPSPTPTATTLADLYRDHFHERRQGDPAVPVTQLLQKIQELGYAGSANLLARYLNQGGPKATAP
ncbi:hypothetical protein GCM10015535_67010 [Streptomyces gelaticus]|uniref:Uncharacterized protein n=1 Tax=Streptomyces gelaticus TaxID=285446 RepID=A0ABQ2W8K3_9ACTN|nr:hypothetical protein GCM10015535_67010 [Streptomyces gelaticus]